MTIILHLLTTYAIFSLFFILLASLGGLILHIFQKYRKSKWNLTRLEYFFISFIIGIVTYLVLSYIITFFHIFNFYTIYLPLIALSLIYILILYRERKFHNLWIWIKAFIRTNSGAFFKYILIIAIAFLMQLLMFLPIVMENIQLSYGDPYFWTKQVLYLEKYSVTNYNDMGISYPWGFVLFCGGSLLISPDFVTTFYFMKLSFFPFLNIYLIVIFSLTKRLFKKKYLVFFCLFAVLSNIYFVSRTMAFLSSSIADLLILISLLIYLTNVPKFFMGFVVSGTFLLNPVYSIYFVMALILYYSIKLYNYQGKKKVVIKEFSSIFLVSIMGLIIYGLSAILIYHFDLIIFYNLFLSYFSIQSITIPDVPIYIQDWNLLYNILEIPYLIVFFGFPILAITSKFKKSKNIMFRDFIYFIKGAGILTYLFIFILPLIIHSRFFDIFYPRVLEIFLPCLIFLTIFSLETFESIFSKLWLKLKFLQVKIRNWKNKNRFVNKYFKVPILSSIFFGILLILSNFYTHVNLKVDYRYEDSIMDCIFYIQDNISSNSNIGVNRFGETDFYLSHSPAALLYIYDLSYFPSEDHLSFSEFTNFIQMNEIHYFIIRLSSYNVSFNEDFLNFSFTWLGGGTNAIKFQVFGT